MPGASFGIQPENLNVLKTADVDNGFVKMDHQLSERNRLSGRLAGSRLHDHRGRGHP